MGIEAFKAIELGIPLWQMSLYTIVITLLMLFGYNRLGFTVSIGFVLYWGFVYNREKLNAFLGSSTLSMVIYLICGIICGIILVFLILISLFIKE